MNATTLGSFPSPQLLADAFSEFIAASSVLEASYRDLQGEVAQLGAELSQRNAELTRSLAENNRMRSALQQMLDSMPCGVLVLDGDRKIVMINPEGRRLLALPETEIQSLQALSQLSQVRFEALADRTDQFFETEVCVDGPAGPRWLAIGIRRLQNAWNQSEGAERSAHLESIWTLRDTTVMRQAEQERETARRATTLAEISTILAHEIRNPLASLELFVGLLESDPAESQQWIANLRAGVRTLAGTVNNVLSLNGEGKPHMGAVDLKSSVESGVEFVRPVAAQAGIKLACATSNGSPKVLANEDGIRQIILNLVRNAIRHTPAGGEIEVTTSSTINPGTSLAVVMIRDTGCGISAEAQTQIFEAGFSGTGETPGLGLAVCRKLMNQMAGTIRVQSVAGKGATFFLEFPTL